MRSLLSCCFILLSLIPCIGADKEHPYAVSSIAPDLLTNADAVVRNSELVVDIISADEVHILRRYTITILNKDAYDRSRLYEYYDELFNHIDHIKGTLYDKTGKQVKKIGVGDIINGTPYGSFLRFDDIKLKSFDFGYADYPFTVSYEIEVTQKQSFALPLFQPQYSKRCAVERASAVINYPADLPLRFRSFHLADKPVLTATAQGKRIDIHVGAIKAEKPIEMDPFEEFSLCSVIFASDSFEFGGRKGSMATWKEFGKFFYDLNANRDSLTRKVKVKIHKLTDSCGGKKAKIDLLYAYLQGDTRYVAVEQGIGGWQALEAAFVCTNKYADCKGLANYMGAMLKEIGIKSYGVLIEGSMERKREMLPDFPANAFNHYILCVPLDKDTVWMDCTSNTAPAGYLAEFTSDRNALLLTPEGGYIVRTPAYTLSQNRASRNMQMHVGAQDSCTGSLIVHYGGSLFDDEYRHVNHKTKNEIEQHVKKKISVRGAAIGSTSIETHVTNGVPEVQENISFSGQCKIAHSGKRTIIDPPLLQVSVQQPADQELRTTPFELERTFSFSDTVVMQMGGEYTVEYLPEEVNMNYPFGSYSCRMYWEENNVLKIVSGYTHIKGVYPASLFPPYIQYAKKIHAGADHVVLVAQE